jgi:hypothetical protein
MRTAHRRFESRSAINTQLFTNEDPTCPCGPARPRTPDPVPQVRQRHDRAGGDPALIAGWIKETTAIKNGARRAYCPVWVVLDVTARQAVLDPGDAYASASDPCCKVEISARVDSAP